jgi:hypothetical protein
MRLVRRVSRFAKRPALAQEVPALVQLDLDCLQTMALVGVERSLFKKLVLFGDEVLNVAQNRSIVFWVFHFVSSLRLKI